MVDGKVTLAVIVTLSSTWRIHAHSDFGTCLSVLVHS